MIHAGRLRHRVAIQQRVEARTLTGAVTIEWQDFATDVPAEFKPLSVKEFLAGNQINSQVTARVTIRYRPGVTATMRIVFRGEYYNIAGVLADAESGLEYLTLPVSAGVNDG